MWRQLFVPLLLMVFWRSDQACAGISATLTTIKDMVTDLQDQMMDMRHKMAQIDDIESQLSVLRTVQDQTKEKMDKIDTIEAQLSALGTRQEQIKDRMDNGEGSSPLFDPGVVEARLTGVDGKAENMDASVDCDVQLTSIQLQLAEIQQNTANLDEMESQLTVMSEQLRDLPSITDSQVQSGVTSISERIEERCPAGSGLSLRRSLSEKFIREEKDYFLAFRLSGGIGTSAYDKYVSVGQNDDNNDIIYSTVPCGCKTTEGNCDRHYRSELLDLWPELPVEKVKVSVYTEGEEKVRLVFDGRGTDHLTFFTLDRLLVTPFTDLPSGYNPGHRGAFFSIAGDEQAAALRRFFINKNYGGCHMDEGWLLVTELDSDFSCAWEDKGGPLPAIWYPLKNESVKWTSEESAIANVLTISIKLTEDDSC